MGVLETKMRDSNRGGEGRGAKGGTPETKDHLTGDMET